MSTTYAKSHEEKSMICEEILNSEGVIEVSIKAGGTITDQQMRAVHLWFQWLATEMNKGGISLQKSLEQRLEVPWNKTIIKELVWRPAMNALKEQERVSTTELYKMEISDVIEVVANWFQSRHGVHVPFPSDETNGGNW